MQKNNYLQVDCFFSVLSVKRSLFFVLKKCKDIISKIKEAIFKNKSDKSSDINKNEVSNTRKILILDTSLLKSVIFFKIKYQF